MPAYHFEVEEAQEEGVAFEWLAAPVELLGKERIEAVLFDRLRLGEQDARGRHALAPTGERFLLLADTVIGAIGQSAQPELLTWGLTHRDGGLDIDEAGRTRLPHVYAGGDAVNGGASVVQAVADGRRAAQAIEEDLCRV